MFNGSITPKLCHLYNLQIMDLAHNHITGRIPHCFGNLSAMVFGQTNFFWAGYSAEPSIYTDKLTQVIIGRELEYMRIVLHIAVNLDLSCNNFVGPIRGELTNLTGLIGLNRKSLDRKHPKQHWSDEVIAITGFLSKQPFRLDSRKRSVVIFLKPPELIVQQDVRTNPIRQPAPNLS
ncbi:hypothetical protein IFM89_038996 [Coptis chinensis]|uniref:Uncharacterized protein n=1 Tax=Coptis chinensis TaxID=261450 RepID=A0A835M8M4_9MAGN|nr:hypothetical protein IFM89_038996 [Coptis chinensis]